MISYNPVLLPPHLYKKKKKNTSTITRNVIIHNTSAFEHIALLPGAIVSTEIIPYIDRQI